jgi:hypothetical protein
VRQADGTEVSMNADGQPDEAIEVLRQVWTRSGQSTEDLESALGPQRSCKPMQNVTFEGWADAEGGAGQGGDIRSAWRATLERDGKVGHGSGTVADLVLGQAESQR